MVELGPFDETKDDMYLGLLAEFPEIPPEAIEMALQCLKVATSMQLSKEAVFEKHGLTAARFSLLMLLRREPSRALSPSALAERANVARGTMTQFLDALERDRLVRRMKDPDDRRGLIIKLTPKAEAVLKRVLPEHLKRLSCYATALTPAERRRLLELMGKLSGFKGI